MSAPKRKGPAPVTEEQEEISEVPRRGPYDPNDLDEVRDLWEDRGYRTPDPGGWQGPDD